MTTTANHDVSPQAALRLALGPGFMFAGPSDRVLNIAVGRDGSTKTHSQR